jgi:hypothetical protein
LREIVRLVEAKQPRRRPANIGEAGNLRGFAPEMILPAIAPRMKEPRQRAGIGIEAGEIRPFERVAPAAGQRQIAVVVRSAVLSRGDVLDLKRRFVLLALAEPAVFAAMPARSRTRCRNCASMC